MINDCYLCKNGRLLADDTLYENGESEEGQLFTYIFGVKYCPVCGKKLMTFDEWKWEKTNEMSVPVKTYDEWLKEDKNGTIESNPT